jgi:pimeloyl-ACP methyl ester carboxylesterase
VNAAALRLAYWLGPWAEKRTPRKIVREVIAAGDVATYVYEPHGSVRGVYVVAPGLHFLGPDDPRLDRFCRIVAAAGFRVYAPKLPDFLALRVAETAADDLAAVVRRAADDARAKRLSRPTLMSISFGSRPAIEVAAEHAAHVGQLILFGGFCDFDATVRFAITGHAEHEGRTLSVARDPLNAPVVFMNLLPWLAVGAEVDRDAVARAWREMVEATWGKMELKAPGARDPIAHRIAARLGARERELFLLGCTLAAPAVAEAALEAALGKAMPSFAWTDPRADLARVRAPITIVHGRDDDVIPVFEAEKLARVAPNARVLITGMYGHTGSALPSPRALAGEVATLVRVVRTLARRVSDAS